MLAVLTGPVRSGKSRLALELAAASGSPVLLAVAGLAVDAEMARRIERHRASRGPDVRVLEIADPRAWLDQVPGDDCLVLDCLGTLVARFMGTEVIGGVETASADAEAVLDREVDRLIAGLEARAGDTVIVTNEVGWGVVPATPSGRLFRDVVGRASARLIERADAAWLVVGGRAVDLGSAPKGVSWPTR